MIVDIETGEIIATTSLAHYEGIIERGFTTFVEVGTALAAIRDQRLYRDTHSTFEDYCRQRWGMVASRARQLIAASETMHALESVTNVTLPASEAQARPLSALEPEDQQIVWKVVTETAPDGNVTAAHVKSVVNVFREVMITGALDNGDGESVSVHDLVHVAVTQESHERMLRQKQHISDKLAPLMSSASNEWYTTGDIIQAVIAIMGGIDLDPCSNSHDVPNVPASQYFTKEDNGLVQEWHGRVYMNPPYGREIVNWMQKLVSEYKSGRVTQAIILSPARPDPEWFRVLRDFPRCFMSKRVRFNNNPNSAPFPTMLVNVGCDPDRFNEVMGKMGDIYARIV